MRVASPRALADPGAYIYREPVHRQDQRPTLRLGVSSCLLGAAVRFDGGHKQHRFLTDVLADYVEWVTICPEVEAGMGVPREPVRLVDDLDTPRMVGVRSATDYTPTMRRFITRRIRELSALHLDGYVFKHGSPSCGLGRVRGHPDSGSIRNGRGLFSAAMLAAHPLLPVVEEGHLDNLARRENFIEQLFAYRRWRTLADTHPTRADLAGFHAAHAYLLRAHNPQQCRALDRLVSEQTQLRPATAVRRYGTGFMMALATMATRPKHATTLRQIARHCRTYLELHDRTELAQRIDAYYRGRVPWLEPITLLRHHIDRYQIPDLEHQVYLRPHPHELMLRNHV